MKDNFLDSIFERGFADAVRGRPFMVEYENYAEHAQMQYEQGRQAGAAWLCERARKGYKGPRGTISRPAVALNYASRQYLEELRWIRAHFATNLREAVYPTRVASSRASGVRASRGETKEAS